MTATRPGIILDRDGTLIDFYRDLELGVVTRAFHRDHLVLLPGVVEGLTRLQRAGFVLAIATNQPDAAKGRVTSAAIAATNQQLVERLAQAGITIAALLACTHHPEGSPAGEQALITACNCRKPAPGMLLQHARQLDLDIAASWMVGDTASDIGAAQAAGMRMGLLARSARCELCVLVGCTPTGLSVHAQAERMDELADLIIAQHQAAPLRSSRTS